MSRSRRAKDDRIGEWADRVLTGEEPEFPDTDKQGYMHRGSFLTGMFVGPSVFFADLLFGSWWKRRRKVDL